MADIVRDIVLRVSLQQEKAEIEIPEMKEAKEALASYAKTIEEVSGGATKHAQEVSKAMQTASRATKQATASASVDIGAMTQGMQVAAMAALGVGRAVFTLARGIAFLAASSSESFETAVRWIARAQGAFDVFVGLVSGVTSLITAMELLKFVTAAVTVKQAAWIAVMGACNLAVKALSGALAIMNMLLGPVGWAVLAAAGAYVALKTALGTATRWMEGTNAEFETAEQRAHRLAVQLNEATSALRAFETTTKASRARQGMLTGDALLQDLKLEQAAIDAQQRTMEGQSLKAGEARIEQQRLVVQLATREVEIAKARRQELERADKARMSELQKQERAAKIAQDLLKAEQQRVQTIEAAIGAMSRAEMSEFMRLTQLAQEGQLTQQQEQRLMALAAPVAGEFVRGRREERGRQALAEMGGLPAIYGGALRGESSELQKLADAARAAGDPVKLRQAIADMQTAMESRDEKLRELIIEFIMALREQEVELDHMQAMHSRQETTLRAHQATK